LSKTVISLFDDRQKLYSLVDAAISQGFDSRLFSIVSSRANETSLFGSAICGVPAIQARLYKKALQNGESLLITHVPEEKVAELIKLLQAEGGHQIEAFDTVLRSKSAHIV
jgi:hypothetical protein